MLCLAGNDPEESDLRVAQLSVTVALAVQEGGALLGLDVQGSHK
jgi:hypothetical protein